MSTQLTETGPIASDTASEEVPWSRLSPLMLAVHPVQEVIRLFPVLIGVLLLGRNGNGELWGLATLGIAVLIGFLRWLTTSYQITSEEVRLRHGFVRRQELSVLRDRVRSVDLAANFMQRLLGLSKVTIGTGRSDRHDEGVKLNALSTVDANRLREELLHRKHKPEAVRRPSTPSATVTRLDERAKKAESAEPIQSVETTIAALDSRWIRFGPFTLAGLATIGVVVGLVSQVLGEAHLSPENLGPLRAILAYLNSVSLPLAVVEVGVASLLLVALLSTIGYVFAFWGFSLSRHREGTLHVSRGLLNTRSTTIEERRLRGVEISESLLLRIVRGARLMAITTGIRVGHGAERGGSLLLPPAPLAEVRRVAGEVFGAAEPMSHALTPHGTRARRRRYTRALGVSSLIIAALLVLWWTGVVPAWGWQASLVLLPISLLLAVDRYRSLGHALLGRTLVVCQGSILRRRYVLSCDGIIGLTLHESFFQRRAGLATISASTAAGRQHYYSLDVQLDEAVALAQEILPEHIAPFLVTT